MLQKITKKKILIFLLGIFTATALAWFYTAEPCTLRSCKFSQIMMEVGKAQIDIESQISNMDGGRKFIAPQLASKYLAYSHITTNGTIIVENVKDDLLLIFEPVVSEKKVNWKCTGKPDFLFSPSYKSGVSECGAQYRQLLRNP